jgi:Tfp pilus assembly protein PilF
VKLQVDRPRGPRIESTIVNTAQREQREIATFHLDRGRRLYEQEKDREAIAELRRAIYLSPYQSEPHLLLGRVYLRVGRVKEAIEELKIAVWSEDTAAAHVALAEAYLQTKDTAAAAAEAERALAIDPASGDARALLDRIRSAGAQP